jgi:signal transduction histidine kinase
MLLFIRRLTRRIVRLSREAEIIGGGDLEAPITRSGEDELSTLANEMDQMRRSVIERMGNERRAWEANSELITAISHDIRTPMTALIGYLGLLNAEGFDDKEKAGQFASSAYAKAMELKDLTDELFRYFLVFGRSELELNLEELDARLLLDQLFAEAQFDLVDAGFTVDIKEFEGEGRIQVDPLYLKRVLDNLVSNAKKYADKAKPISVRAELSEGSLRIAMSNAVAKAMNRVESTKIGLRTCEKIMSSMQGSFSSELNGETFTAYLSLPVLYPDDKKAKR